MSDRLVLRDLRIRAGTQTLVDGVALELEPGRIVMLVGSSGSGKTLTARALLGMVHADPGVEDADLEIRCGGNTWRPYAASRRRDQQARFRELRGSVVGYLPQDARGSLDPLWTIGRQVQEALDLARDDAAIGAVLKRAGLEPRVAALYPHELSGGMAQRACIALALARGSRFLVVDEPTTGLDPSIREAILQELAALRDTGVAILFITHDLRLVPRFADHLLVMSGGRLVESVPAQPLPELQAPEAKALWEATARIAGGALGPVP